MKSSYTRRNGHERTRFTKTSLNSAATARRERALVRLKERVKENSKLSPDDQFLRQVDLDKINKEIANLERKIKTGI